MITPPQLFHVTKPTFLSIYQTPVGLVSCHKLFLTFSLPALSYSFLQQDQTFTKGSLSTFQQKFAQI